MMKVVYVLVAIAVIAAIAFMFSNENGDMGTESASEAPTEQSNEMDTQEDASVDTGSDMDETQSSESEADMGSDAGMEFPTIEGDVELDAEASAEAETGNAVSFTVDAFNFGYSMEEIRVSEGDTVTINLTNSDGFHDWVVDEFGVATEQISEGGTTSVTFVADEAGTFEYYCSVGNHRAQGMVGALIVE